MRRIIRLQSIYAEGSEISLNEVIMLAPGSYNLEIINNSICSYTQDIIIPEALAIDVQIVGPSIVNYGLSHTYSIELNPLGDYNEVVWSFNDSIITVPIEEYAFPSNGILCVEFLYENECILNSCKPITVTDPNVYIPNIISLSTGSSNTDFEIFCNDPGAIVESLLIYDRWGNLLFSAENLPVGNSSLIWDGSFNAQPLNPGVYVFTAALRYSNGNQEQFAGDITLIN